MATGPNEHEESTLRAIRDNGEGLAGEEILGFQKERKGIKYRNTYQNLVNNLIENKIFLVNCLTDSVHKS